MQRSAWLVAWVAWVLCAWAGVLLFGNKNAGISGTNELADRFVTQLALETYRPGGIITSSSMEGWTGENSGFIDLSLKKELPGYSNTFYLFLLTVTNHGNQTATNFTVKDYIPYGWSFDMVLWWTILGNTATWKIDSLWAGESKQLRAWVKRKNALLVNKAQICDYEEAGEWQDYDSNPCNMKPLWSPKEDDESMVTILTGSTGASHLACVNQACVYVAGAGPNTCSNNYSCAITNSGNTTTGVVNTWNTNTGSTNTGNTNTGNTNTGGTNSWEMSDCGVMITNTWYSWNTGSRSGSGMWSGLLGNIVFQIVPSPLYPGYSYPSTCTITQSNPNYPAQWLVPYNATNGGAVYGLGLGYGNIKCSVITPTGQTMMCAPWYFSF